MGEQKGWPVIRAQILGDLGGSGAGRLLMSQPQISEHWLTRGNALHRGCVRLIRDIQRGSFFAKVSLRFLLQFLFISIPCSAELQGVEVFAICFSSY
jgi:hypothetical protein